MLPCASLHAAGVDNQLIAQNTRNYRVFEKEILSHENTENNMEKSIQPFAERYFQREAEKAKEEGFVPCGMDFSHPDDTIYEYTIRYQEVKR